MNDELVQEFGTAESVQNQVSALAKLIKNKALTKVLREPSFEKGFTRLVELASNPKFEMERLVAVAALSRIASIARSQRQRVFGILSVKLIEPLPPIQLLPDPDDRFYVASVWRSARSDWWRGYLAEAAVEEETAERVRIQCLKGLCGISHELSDVLDELRLSLVKVRFGTQRPEESMGRRLRRLLIGLRISIESVDKEPGIDAGTKLAILVRDAFRSSGIPTESHLRMEIGDEVASIVHGLVRARFSMASLPDTYEAMDVIRSWFDPSDWQIFAEGSRPCALVARDVLESLNLLVRAGVADDKLFHELTIAVGSLETARKLCRELADKLPGISDHLRDWLLGRSARMRSPLAAESQERLLDEIIAEVWIETSRLSDSIKLLRQDFLPQIIVVAPRLADSLDKFIGICEGLIGTLRLLAHRRSLRIRGQIGQETEFTPLDHDMIGDLRPGIRRVRIVKPVVESVEQDGAIRLVKKGLVEAVEKTSLELP